MPLSENVKLGLAARHESVMTDPVGFKHYISFRKDSTTKVSEKYTAAERCFVDERECNPPENHNIHPPPAASQRIKVSK